MADTAEEPLMGRSQNDDVEEELNDVSLLLEKNLKNPGVFVWLLTFSAGISGLLFGCKLDFCICGNLLMIAG
jgi:SP family myo-inositol transporter-like MFS transporter 13